MKVEIIVDPSRAAAANATLAGRLAPAATGQETVQPKQGRVAGSATVAAASGSAVQRAPGSGAGRRRGGGGRGGARRERAPERPKATVEDLDAEMNDWQAQAQAAGNGAAAGEATA
ncbi:hypothetical protein JCM10213_005865 [Rhodosporidiobolus nylandii]